ncbi:MAG: hypothetical protein EBT92_01290 [Planctomycetes bacterium]|nr:hypothetical protein [Planctomycetota bacterium]
MYGFRKPFTASSYSDIYFFGFDYKTVLVVGQVLGYMLSKFIGIKFISEMPYHGRSLLILYLIGFSHFALLCFALIPAPWNCFMLFFNGIPLGMVFGLVMGFLEGRRITEALLGFLCASFILADGFCKSVGSFLLDKGISDHWMPFVSGTFFIIPLLVFVWMLSRISQPKNLDVIARSERSPMYIEDRRRFFSKYFIGLSLILLVYLLVTILRSIRADYSPEIWKGLGFDAKPEKFTISELWVTLGIVISSGVMILVKNNKIAFYLAMFVAFLGFFLAGISVIGLMSNLLDGFWFMVLVGLGLYLPYVLVHTTIFERLLAMTRERGNCSYLMYLADAIGYLGYVAVIISGVFVSRQISLLNQFVILVSLISVVSGILIIFASIYFANRLRDNTN